MHRRHFSMEHHNTGKTPQKCYSCIVEGMHKLTEDTATYVRTRVTFTNVTFC